MILNNKLYFHNDKQCFTHIRPLGAAGAVSGRNMFMFSRHRKLDFNKIISFISGLKYLQKL